MYFGAAIVTVAIARVQRNRPSASRPPPTRQANRPGLAMVRMVAGTNHTHRHHLLWPPYEIGQAIIFLPCGFYLSSIFYLFSSPNLSGRRSDVYHTSTHGVALVRI